MKYKIGTKFTPISDYHTAAFGLILTYVGPSKFDECIKLKASDGQIIDWYINNVRVLKESATNNYIARNYKNKLVKK